MKSLVRDFSYLLLLGLMPVLNAESADLLLGPTHGGDGAAWGLEQCAGCHPLRRIHRQAPKVRGIVQSKGYGTCTGCHGDNGSAAKRPCVVCHNPTDLPAAPRRDGVHRHGFDHLSGDGECLACHHASDMDGDFRPNRDLTALPDGTGRPAPYFSTADFCLRCHKRNQPVAGFEIDSGDYRDPLVAMRDNYAHMDFHGLRPGGKGSYSGLRQGYQYPMAVPCTDCHAMHGSANPGLLIDNSAKGVSLLDPALRQAEIPVHVVDGDYAQLCVLCHRLEQAIEEAETDTGNGLKGVHQAFGDCRPCHAHGQPEQAGL